MSHFYFCLPWLLKSCIPVILKCTPILLFLLKYCCVVIQYHTNCNNSYLCDLQHRRMGHGFRFLPPPFFQNFHINHYFFKIFIIIRFFFIWQYQLTSYIMNNTCILCPQFFDWYSIREKVSNSIFIFRAISLSSVGKPPCFIYTFYLVYIWHLRNCPCSNFSRYVDLFQEISPRIARQLRF